LEIRAAIPEGAGPNGPNRLSAELIKLSSVAPDTKTVRYAAEFIRRGEVVGVPTDTFYALAADPFNLAAVEEIYRAKGRPENRALPILVSSIDQAVQLARDLPPNFLKLATKFWPGPLTLLVDASQKIPLKVTAGMGRAAVRWPNSPTACALIDQLGGPITGTSANISGFPSCSNAEQLMEQLGDRLPLILDAGDTGGMISSTIVDLRDGEWRVIREGLVSGEDIESAVSAE
jgi:L-threonylcarbamoyladenylate synthase